MELTIRVEICRIADSDGGWSLEVIDQENTSTVWDSTFVADEEAYREFSRTLEREGIRSFAERPTGRTH